MRPERQVMLGRRNGAVTLEALLAVPLLVIVTWAAFEFGIILVVQQAVSHAATVAARESGKLTDFKQPAEIAPIVEQVVERVLEPHKITVGPSANYRLEVGSGSGPVSFTNNAALDCDPPTTPIVAEDEVRVSVCVRLNNTPFVNCLAAFGIDISDRCYRASSLVKKE